MAFLKPCKLLRHILINIFHPSNSISNSIYYLSGWSRQIWGLSMEKNRGGQQRFKCHPPPPQCHQKGVELFSQAGATHFHGWKHFAWMDSPVRYGPTPNRPPLAINTRAFPKSMQICHLIGTKLKGQTLPKICKCKKSFYFYRGLPRMAVMAQAIKDVWTCLQQTCFTPAQPRDEPILSMYNEDE